MRKIVTISALVMMGFATPAFSQMRENVPGVIQQEAPRGPDVGAIVGSFKKSYTAHKQPRIVVFWNRQFSEELATGYQDQLRLTQRENSQSTVERESYATRFGSGSFKERQSSAEGEQIIRSETARVDPDRKTLAMDENIEWRLESGFQQPFIQAGAKLIDRTTIMRTSKQGLAAGDKANIQAVETSALTDKAEILVEVLIVQDPKALTGLTYRVDVKEIASGQIVARFVTNATPANAGQKQYYANDKGFASTVTPPQVDEVGQQLGIETMMALINSWS